MDNNAKIYVAGHRGLVGSAVCNVLREEGYRNVICKTHAELDLTRQQETEDFFLSEKPQYVFLCAAKVGGIMANSTYKAQFIYDNISIACNVIHAAYRAGVKKLINLGSSCIYPKYAAQPITEKSLLTGSLEQTNESYAIAKIAAIKLCRYYNEQYGTSFISAMPSNIYGPGDNFDLETSHVLPALIHKFHRAKEKKIREVVLWGDGSPKREFLYSIDLAHALLFLMKHCSVSDVGEHVNVGTGVDISIRDLVQIIQGIVKSDAAVLWDTSKPNGTPKKCMELSKMNALGWRASTALEEGIKNTYQWFVRYAYTLNNP